VGGVSQGIEGSFALAFVSPYWGPPPLGVFPDCGPESLDLFFQYLPFLVFIKPFYRACTSLSSLMVFLRKASRRAFVLGASTLWHPTQRVLFPSSWLWRDSPTFVKNPCFTLVNSFLGFFFFWFVAEHPIHADRQNWPEKSAAALLRLSCFSSGPSRTVASPFSRSSYAQCLPPSSRLGCIHTKRVLSSWGPFTSNTASLQLLSVFPRMPLLFSCSRG